MEELTAKQRRVYVFIRDTIAARQTPPTRAEIAEALGFASANAAQAHLRTLENKGFIELNARRSRGIRLVTPDDASDEPFTQSSAGALSLAVVGRVAAGAPILALEHVERRCRVSADLFSARPDYLLRVTGDSMIGAGILDGDLLAVRTAPEVRPGDIAVFRWDDEVTVKRFARDGQTARLIAENPRYEDIVIDTTRETLSLEGLAVGVIRNL
ncbi:transcriptional repressor LexA [Salinisphaera aquimarina]|uniref:LexA repressor n=1 Tax=Salinisphaera aquimarina TaxID=2094031 RepID=A0ABV7EWP6_9GAMM